MYLIDSDIIIYSLKNHPPVRQRFEEKFAIPKAISVISYGELYYGAKKSKQKEKNLAVVRRISELFPIINTTKSIMETFADIKVELQVEGKLISATALTHDFILISNNEKHFNRITSLHMENWTK